MGSGSSRKNIYIDAFYVGQEHFTVKIRAGRHLAMRMFEKCHCVPVPRHKKDALLNLLSPQPSSVLQPVVGLLGFLFASREGQRKLTQGKGGLFCLVELQVSGLGLASGTAGSRFSNDESEALPLSLSVLSCLLSSLWFHSWAVLSGGVRFSPEL